MEEIWRDIKGYEGHYQVSNFGNVKTMSRTYYSGRDHNNIKTIEEMPLSQHCTHKYYRVLLRKNGTKKMPTVHRLVALAFITNPENKPCINHKDANKFNNNVENLEWCTYKENNQHAWDNNLFPCNKGGKNGFAKAVGKYSINGKLIAIFETIRDAAKDIGRGEKVLGDHCHGRVQKQFLNGFKWRFV